MKFCLWLFSVIQCGSIESQSEGLNIHGLTDSDLEEQRRCCSTQQIQNIIKKSTGLHFK